MTKVLIKTILFPCSQVPSIMHITVRNTFMYYTVTQSVANLSINTICPIMLFLSNLGHFVL